MDIFNYLLIYGVTVYIAGNTANASDNPEVPAGASTARANVTATGVLWYLTGPGSTQQVWVIGAVSPGAAAGTQAAVGEVAQRGQGAWCRKKINHLKVVAFIL